MSRSYTSPLSRVAGQFYFTVAIITSDVTDDDNDYNSNNHKHNIMILQFHLLLLLFS
jgi:hypothetical protein